MEPEGLLDAFALVDCHSRVKMRESNDRGGILMSLTYGFNVLAAFAAMAFVAAIVFGAV
jgi:hypothetical protein